MQSCKEIKNQMKIVSLNSRITCLESFFYYNFKLFSSCTSRYSVLYAFCLTPSWPMMSYIHRVVVSKCLKFTTGYFILENYDVLELISCVRRAILSIVKRYRRACSVMVARETWYAVKYLYTCKYYCITSMIDLCFDTRKILVTQ